MKNVEGNTVSCAHTNPTLTLPEQEILRHSIEPHTSFYSVTQLLCSNICPITVTMCRLFQSNMVSCLCGMRLLGHEMTHFSELINVRCRSFPPDPNGKTLGLHNATQTPIWVTYTNSVSFSVKSG